VLALIGANGAGKTTLIDVVTGATPLQRGHVLLEDREIGAERIETRARLGVGRTFQSVRTFDNLTVEEGVRLGGSAAGGIDQERIDQLLTATGLENRCDELPAALALSERRLLDVARALAGAPTVMLLDEPSAGMNEAERDELGAMILTVRKAGTTVIVVDHNLDLVVGIADRVAVLDFGRLLAIGAPNLVFDDPSVRRAYLGDTESPAPSDEVR
jgi:ABC-type branched-subunit amino acid transport system ATPase component